MKRKSKLIDARLEELESVKKPDPDTQYIAVFGDEVEEGDNDFVAEWTDDEETKSKLRRSNREETTPEPE